VVFIREIRVVVEHENEKGHPHGLDEPIFRADFSNPSRTFSSHGEKLCPLIQLYFYDIGSKTHVMQVIEKERLYSWNIPVYFGETEDYVVVTSPSFVNHGVFTEEAKKTIQPMWDVLRKHIENKEGGSVEQLVQLPQEISLPSANDAFRQMYSGKFAGKTLSEIVPPKSVKLIAITGIYGHGWTYEFTPNRDVDNLIRLAFTSDAKAKDFALSDTETILAQYSIVTIDGYLFVLEVLGSFIEQRPITAFLVRGEGFGCRFEVDDIKGSGIFVTTPQLLAKLEDETKILSLPKTSSGG